MMSEMVLQLFLRDPGEVGKFCRRLRRLVSARHVTSLSVVGTEDVSPTPLSVP